MLQSMGRITDFIRVMEYMILYNIELKYVKIIQEAGCVVFIQHKYDHI